jgi:hypothetical protein
MFENPECLALIIIRLRHAHRTCNSASIGALNTTLPVAKLLLETGAIYCVATLTILVLDLSKNEIQIIILNAVSLQERSNASLPEPHHFS